jgi:hypothetical protein
VEIDGKPVSENLITFACLLRQAKKVGWEAVELNTNAVVGRDVRLVGSDL